MRSLLMRESEQEQPPAPQHLVVRVCLARLVFLLVLLFPLSLTWWIDPSAQPFSGTFQRIGSQLFLIFGFAATIFFLATRHLFSRLMAFFRLQMATDLILVSFLILITGALQSNFAFIGLGLLFLYGRILGLQAAYVLAICLSLLYMGLACAQTLGIFFSLPLHQACLYASLHLLALALMLLLVRMHAGRLEALLQEMAARERQLRSAEDLKRRVLDWMPSGVLVIDGQGRISTINAQAVEWAFFIDRASAISTALHRAYPGLYTLWAHWGGEETLRSEFEHGPLLFGATLTKLPDNQGSLALFTDITRIKELEHQVREMEKMATVGELAAGLAHEIKNPLAGIKASLQLLPSQKLTPEKRTRLSKVIDRDIQRLTHLLNNFLSFARPEQAVSRRVSLESSVQSCLMTIQPSFPRISFQVEPSLQGRIWTWDPDHLHQVLLNLLMNAAQAVAAEEEPRIMIFWEKMDQEEDLAIADNGPGLDDHLRNKVFDPFTTSKAQGSGLGLSIAQRLATQNNAWIQISEDGPFATGVVARISTSTSHHK